MVDPRRLLERAAELRAGCELLPRRGFWRHGEIVRVEKGGVVARVGGTPLESGVDVRAWLRIDGIPYTFEASVLRAGVAIPDRSQKGVLLGFIDGWQRADQVAGVFALEVVPPNGSPVSLLAGDVRLVDLSPEDWTISAPTGFTLVFVEQGAVRLRLSVPDRPPLDVQARVHRLARADGHLLYALHVEHVDDADAYRAMVDGIRGVMEI